MTASSDSVQNQEGRANIYLPTSSFHSSEGGTTKSNFPCFSVVLEPFFLKPSFSWTKNDKNERKGREQEAKHSRWA